jgi:hypothetical protein
MERLELEGRWKRYVGGEFVDSVQVPGSYEPLGECRLEREFPFDPTRAEPGSRYFLVSEGVLASASFNLNGHELGRAGPWVTYRFELPAGSLRAANVVEARVRDMTEKFGLTPGRRMDAGLIRSVYLERRPAAFISDMLFDYEISPDMGSVKCRVKVEIDGDQRGTTLELLLKDGATGREVAKASAAAGKPILFELDEPLLWSPDSPRLYELSVTARGGAADGDEAREAVGFRRIEIRGRDFFLNGKRLLLNGVCRHEFLASYPFCPPADVVERDLALI